MLFDFGVSVTCVCVLILERAPFLQQKGVDLEIIPVDEMFLAFSCYVVVSK